ncbi:aldose epimerase family protein [Falsibacillus albus]|uniref:Aldose 1-epimerase n=1 Tax=Falsibacillus albus TaxID=2478915 RepID=A0A3L7JY78_9BACI|nr:aldose epimerase family protein [Falsibacillus albus]RLQ94641.1 galactose mutarotase [Falsibacillus albus]
MQMKEVSLSNGWKKFNLWNDHGIKVSVLNYGGIITEITVPDREGTMENIVLDYKDYRDYENDTNFFGAIIGRVAGRIQGAAFEIGGTVYRLEANDGPNHLHGASHGFHRVLWEAESFQSEDAIGIRLSHFSKDGDGGYPGNIEAAVTYRITNENELIVEYEGKTDRTTLFTMTNHSYFNLSGNVKDPIHDHQVILDSHRFLELDEQLIPTGSVVDAFNTPFDFSQGQKLNEGIIADTKQNQVAGQGYDHYFLFDHTQQESVIAKHERNGRVLTIETDQPGMVLYTGNNLPSGLALAKGPSFKHAGVCFETQSSPASLHHEGLPGVILQPGETYHQRTVFRFTTE